MRKILVRGPALSYSEYGKLCREVLLELVQHTDNDIYLLNSKSDAGWICDTGEFRDNIDEMIMKTSALLNSDEKPEFDACIQVDEVSSWKRMSKVNIGVTNGSKTTSLPPEVLLNCESVDKIVVSDKSQKSAFPENIQRSVEVIPRLVSKIETSEESNIKVSTDFNFLFSSKWEPKNNVEQVITSFFQEFQDEEVGLCLNTYIRSRSSVDRGYTIQHLNELMSLFPKNRKCKLYLIHGNVTSEDLVSDPSVSAYMDVRHTMEHSTYLNNAIASGLPIVSSKWGFLSDVDSDMLYEVEKSIEKLKDRHVHEFSKYSEKEEFHWNYANHDSLRECMRRVYQESSSRDYKLFDKLNNKRLKMIDKMNYNKLLDKTIGEKNETK